MNQSDQQWLLKTLSLAKKRAGFCAPNPAVGAVVVKDGQLIAEGFHDGVGHAHAEVEALNAAGDEAIGADLYVSLEPCCHYGRTPPCTEKIKASRIARVFFAFLDPNPKVAGQGQQMLTDAGIECHHVDVPEITAFYQPYAYWMLNQEPFVTAKIAMTVDGFIANADGSPLQITGEDCRVLTHQNRLASDAILSTAQTVIADDPQFNVRLENKVIKKPLYLLDSAARLPLSAKVFETTDSITIFHAENADEEKVARLKNKGVRCVVTPNKGKKLDLDFIVNCIGHEGVHALWLEAGAECFLSFLSGNLLKKVFVYQSHHALNRLGLSSGIDLIQLRNLAHDMTQHKTGSDTVFIFDLS